MTTYLAINGNKPHEILLDLATKDGATVVHLFRCPSREYAYAKARRVINNESDTLAAFRLSIGQYELLAS